MKKNQTEMNTKTEMQNIIKEIKSRLDVIEEKNQWAGRQNNGNQWC